MTAAPMTAARERIEALIAIARKIADPESTLGKHARLRLPTSSGLSPEGVALALTQHLETSPSARDLTALERSATPASRCHVVLAANVCTAPLRAIACALATSETVFVKPSRRDPVLAELLVEQLQTPGVSLVSQLQVRAGDAVVVYGSDATIETIAGTLPPGAQLHGHGTGLGIAIGDDPDAIAADLVAFDGRGCLSPRLVICDGDPTALGAALHASLSAREDAIPRGPLNGDERAALAQHRQLYAAIGQAHVGAHHAVFVDPKPEVIALAPPLRATVVCGLPSDGNVATWLAPIARHVAALGGADGSLMSTLVTLFPRARRSALGRMQKPPLDGPVDLR